MRFIFGFVMLVIGASIAVNLFFDFGIPIVRSVLALAFVYWGARLVTTAWSQRRAPSAVATSPTR
jgi:hypothetical protein